LSSTTFFALFLAFFLVPLVVLVLSVLALSSSSLFSAGAVEPDESLWL